MGPLPKRKLSRRRKLNRRAHDKLTLIHLVRCDNCGEYKPSHMVCPACGTYHGHQVIAVEDSQ